MSVNEWKVQNYQKVLDFKVHFFFVFGFLYRSINHLSSCPAENIWDILWLQRIFISAVVFRSTEATKDIFMEIKLFDFRFITETGSPLIYFTILENSDQSFSDLFYVLHLCSHLHGRSPLSHDWKEILDSGWKEVPPQSGWMLRWMSWGAQSSRRSFFSSVGGASWGISTKYILDSSSGRNVSKWSNSLNVLIQQRIS